MALWKRIRCRIEKLQVKIAELRIEENKLRKASSSFIAARSGVRATMEEIAIVGRMREQGKKIADIAAELGISYGQANRRIYLWNKKRGTD